MPLSTGDKLGPYEILAPIGAGGMGEVYKARDIRLDRIVAIKTSKTEFSERFEREARSVAALNHPNICTLHDVGANYLVMEYIGGTPLKGPLPVDQALKYAAQICDALDAAHKKGIVHRDLKPGNVLVTKSGIKLLDFGLAKIAQAAKPLDDATLTMALTGKNEIVGTLYYMSPEQLHAEATGQEVDARSDIFSFGLVLYEMLTGKRAFDGASPASVIAGIMERPAPSLGEVAPPGLDRLLQRCLQKDPDDRWQSARDLKNEIDWIASSPREIAATAAASRPQWIWKIAAGASAVALAGISWLAFRPTQPRELKSLVRLDVDLGPDVALTSVRGPNVILSPDGTRIVFVSRGRLHTRKLDQSQATELMGTEGAYAPFFSADGKSIAFFANLSLKKVSLDGGAPETLCEARYGMGGTWGEDGTIIANLNSPGGLSQVSSGGGMPTPLTSVAKGELSHAWPQILPGGNAVLFSSLNGDQNDVEVWSFKDRRKKVIQRSAGFGHYLPSGHLVYVSNSRLMAVPFDVDALEVRGTAVPLMDMSVSPAEGFAQLDISQEGTLVYRNVLGPGSGSTMVQWLDHFGQAQPLIAKPGIYLRPRFSPDGRILALDIPGPKASDVWTYDWERDVLKQLTFDAGGAVTTTAWTPDGRYIVFQGKGGMSWIRSDGTGKPQQITESDNFQLPYSFAPDGKRLAWLQSTPGGGYDLWSAPVEIGSEGITIGKAEPLLQTPFDERHPAFSPDGHWLAYTSNESGTFQVYVRAFPDNGGKRQVSDAGGAYPVWSQKTHELFFRANDNRIMVASYALKGDSFTPDKPKAWSDKQLADFGIVGTVNYDVAPDGKRIAALMQAETPESRQSSNHVVFLMNFLDELRRKVPTHK